LSSTSFFGRKLVGNDFKGNQPSKESSTHLKEIGGLEKSGFRLISKMSIFNLLGCVVAQARQYNLWTNSGWTP
jgi:hypothetical protein